MKTFLQISVSGSRTQTEALLPSLIELGCVGFQETDTHLIGYAELPSSPDEAARIRAAFRDVLRSISANAEVTFGEVADRNWNEEWERTIQPIEIGKRFAIRPSWREYRNDSGRIVLTIDPKMSFGTGYHETTRLMLILLERHTRQGTFVLDVGTGTGVLAIAAVKLGASSAVGSDTDEWSVGNARENVALNRAEGAVTIVQGTIPDGMVPGPGLICANLTLNDLTGLLASFRATLAAGGLLLVSGLLTADEGPIGAALAGAGFEIVETLRENEWLAICAR